MIVVFDLSWFSCHTHTKHLTEMFRQVVGLDLFSVSHCFLVFKKINFKNTNTRQHFITDSTLISKIICNCLKLMYLDMTVDMQ